MASTRRPRVSIHETAFQMYTSHPESGIFQIRFTIFSCQYSTRPEIRTVRTRTTKNRIRPSISNFGCLKANMAPLRLNTNPLYKFIINYPYNLILVNPDQGYILSEKKHPLKTLYKQYFFFPLPWNFSVY